MVKVALGFLAVKNIFDHIKTSFGNHTVPVKNCNVSCDKNMTKHPIVKRIAFPVFKWNKTSWNRTVPVKHCNVSCDKNMTKHLIVKRGIFPTFIWNKTSWNRTVPVKHCNVSCDKNIISKCLGVFKSILFHFFKWNKTSWNRTVPVKHPVKCCNVCDKNMTQLSVVKSIVLPPFTGNMTFGNPIVSMKYCKALV